MLPLVSSKSCEGNRVPLRATISWESGPDCDGLEVRDRALSCSSRDKTIPSPFSSEESRVCRRSRREEAQSQHKCPAQLVGARSDSLERTWAPSEGGTGGSSTAGGAAAETRCGRCWRPVGAAGSSTQRTQAGTNRTPEPLKEREAHARFRQGNTHT